MITQLNFNIYLFKLSLLINFACRRSTYIILLFLMEYIFLKFNVTNFSYTSDFETTDNVTVDLFKKITYIV